MPNKPDPLFEQLMSEWLDGRIDQQASDQLQQRLRESSDDRQAFIAMTQVDAGLRELVDRGDGGNDRAEPTPLGGPAVFASFSATNIKQNAWMRMATAAAVLLMVGAAAYWLGNGSRVGQTASLGPEQSTDDLYTNSQGEATIAGYATLRRAAGVRWADGAKAFREGDVLPAGELVFDEGLAEIDLFCGAGIVVEGPARLNLVSDWVVRLDQGRLRANVPPAARGFVVKTDDADIVDLGTEFALDVRDEHVRVEVIDGEVELRGGQFDGSLLTTGEGLSLKGQQQSGAPLDAMLSDDAFGKQHADAQAQRFAQWLQTSEQLRSDDRLLAYYPIAANGRSLNGRSVLNTAVTGEDLDGRLVGSVTRREGRFGPSSEAIAFERPGSRVRVRIDGTFEAYSFACWVRIDSLKNRYNALLMGDGYENGEPHWQIRNDGKMMFSVMVDDREDPTRDNVTLGRLHRVYITEPIWDVSKSGRWMHLAAVYDPASRRIRQYANGELVSEQEIEDKYHIGELRIGPAEIGNWGQPFRKTPWFAVRNFDGSIDEMAIFSAALSHREVHDLYEAGKPVGY